MTPESESTLKERWNFYTKEQIIKDEYLKQEKFNKPIKEKLQELFGINSNKKILDVGSGLFPETYLPEGHNICYVDWIPQVKNLPNSYVCNAESLPFNNDRFEIVISKQVYGFLLNPEKSLNEMIRVLQPNGLLVIIDWEGKFYGHQDRIKDFEPEKIAEEIKLKGFKIIESTQLIKKTIGEDKHLTAIIARKL